MAFKREKMNKHTAIHIGSVLIIIILSLSLCTERGEHKADVAKMSGAWAADTVRLIKLAAEKDSITRYEMAQKVGSERDARVVAESEAKKYKSLLAVVKVKVGAEVKGVEAKYDTIIKTDTVALADTNCIPVGTTFSYSDKWFYVNGTIGAENVLIDSTGFYPGQIKVIIGDKKGGLFKRKKPVVSVMFENPHYYANSANNIIVQNKTKPRRGLWLLTGIAAGLIGGLLIH